jgi:hypothetical protein
MIRSCNCYHLYQDVTHGPGQRVHTTGDKVHTCTVCGETKPISNRSKKERNEKEQA